MNRNSRLLHVVFGACLFAVAGCVTPLNNQQLAEYDRLSAQGRLVEQKDPKVAAAMGILPGGGSFYTREWGLGIVNLALWPYSILWDPISAMDAAKKTNYYATKTAMQQERQSELTSLNRQLEDDAITQTEYLAQMRMIEDTY